MQIHSYKLKTIVMAFAVTLFAGSVFAQTTAYVDATIETADKAGQLEGATMVVTDGVITAVGKDVKIPADARVVSLTGKTVMPGIIDPYFVFSSSGGGSTGFREVTFRGRVFRIPIRTAATSVAGFKQIAEYFYPFDYNFKPAMRTGITQMNLVSSGQGLSAFADSTDKPTPEMLFQKEGVVFASVSNSTVSLDQIRKPLAEEKKDAKPKTTSTSVSTAASKAAQTKKLWDEVKTGKKRLFVNMNTAASVAYVLQVAKKNEKVKFVLVATGPNLYMSLDQIKSLDNVEIVLQPGIDIVPYTRDLMNVSRMLSENEINFALSMSLARSQMNSNQDDPMFPVASLVHTGLDRQQAIKSLTSIPAKMLGIEKTHGSIAEDKKANFLIFDGDPLKTGSRLEQVYLNGKQIHEN